MISKLKALNGKGQITALSFVVTMLGAIWMIGTKPLVDGKTLAQYVLWRIDQPTPYDIASTQILSNKVDLSDLVQSYEYLLDRHLNKLNGEIKEYCLKNGDLECQIKMKGWEAEREKRQKKLDHIRTIYQDSQAKVEQLLAGRIPSE